MPGRFFFGVDSVPMHIAAAVDTPGVALFGPSCDIEWRPWSERVLPLASLGSPRQAAAPAIRASRPTDIRIVDVAHGFESHTYRTLTYNADKGALAEGKRPFTKEMLFRLADKLYNLDIKPAESPARPGRPVRPATRRERGSLRRVRVL